MTYNFRTMQEIGWAAFVAAGIFALEVVIRTDTIDNWETWAVMLGGGAARAAAGAVLGIVTKPGG